MIEVESHYPTIDQLVGQQRTRRMMLMTLLIVTVLIVIGIVAGLAFFFPRIPAVALSAVGFAAFVCLAVPVIVWNNPRMGLYTLLMTTFVLGPGDLKPTMPGSYAQVWSNVSTIGTIYGTQVFKSLIFSPAELLMIITAITWIVRSIVKREFSPRFGSFFGIIAAYAVMVGIGWIHGITTGGDKTMALYEVRAVAHFVLGYLLAANLLTERKHLSVMLWIIIIGAGLLGLFGTITYRTSPPMGEEGYMVHDNSVLLDLLTFVFLLVFAVRLDVRMRFWAAAVLPTALIANLGNQRRAGIAAFIIAFLPLIPLLYVFLKERRKQIAVFGIAFLMASAIYIPLGWNSEGAWALPARAIRSQSDPSTRDASSDYYRFAEMEDLKATRDSSPWIGIGYGKRFLQPLVLPAVTTDFLAFMAHNSIMWVWMRLGHIGFFLFLMMIATILIKGTQTLREVRDPVVLVAGLLGILLLLMAFVFGKYDLQLVNCRQMFVVAVFVGILSVAKQIDAASPAQPEPKA